MCRVSQRKLAQKRKKLIMVRYKQSARRSTSASAAGGESSFVVGRSRGSGTVRRRRPGDTEVTRKKRRMRPGKEKLFYL